MKISQMEYFSCVCRCGSITKAAKELHISQPSVTAAVHELEKELGVNPVSYTHLDVYKRQQ